MKMEKSQEVVLTLVSSHGKNSQGSKYENGHTIGRTQIGWGMYTLAYGKGPNRKSVTMHCSESDAEAEKVRVKGV